jgi:diacylglycerol kinase family enzyme
VVPGARKLPGAYEVLARGDTVEYDVGYATWDGGSEYFVNGMGSGIDVEVVRQLRHVFTLPGPLKYLTALIRALAVYRPIALNAFLDRETLGRRIMMMAVGNGICQGGGFYLTPNAVPMMAGSSCVSSTSCHCGECPPFFRALCAARMRDTQR